jgi:hypothetical protein
LVHDIVINEVPFLGIPSSSPRVALADLSTNATNNARGMLTDNWNTNLERLSVAPFISGSIILHVVASNYFEVNKNKYEYCLNTKSWHALICHVMF